MDKISSKITVFDKENKNFYKFSQINLLFGYSGSGKTQTISNLISIFSGKTKKFLVDGAQVTPNDFNIINISSGEGLSSHLKLSSKSLIRKTIEKSELDDEFKGSFDMVQRGFEAAQNQLQAFIRKIIPGATLEISSLERPMSLLLDNVSIDVESDSSSESKWSLFSIARKLAEETNSRSLIFVDNFNSDFDEEFTIRFFDEMKKTNAYFFLTSSKTIPQYLLEDDTSVFAIRDMQMIPIPPLNAIALDGITESPEYQTYEEYMLDAGYMQNSSVLKSFLQALKSDVNANVLRILCSKHPVLSPTPIPGKITICPRSKSEEKIYKAIFENLEIPSQNN